MFCFHKFDLVQPDSFQYCKKCGLAKSLKKECSHKWRQKEKQNYYWPEVDFPSHSIFILECELCGDLKRFKPND